MLKTYEQQAKKKLTAILVSVIVVAGAVVALDQLRGKSIATGGDSTTPGPSDSVPSPTAAASISPNSVNGSATATPAATSAPAASAGGYKDGTYTASSTYYVPHGSESIKVTLTLKSGVVTGASVQNSQGDRESAEYQQEFASTYKSYVIGRKISELNLRNIAGASDTTGGFNDAVDQISRQAQA